MYFFLFVVKMIHFSCAIEKEVAPIQKEISVSDTYFPDLYALQLWQNLLLCKKHSVSGGCSDFRKVVFTWRQNHSFKYQGRGVFWNFFILQRNLKTSIISCCKKKYPSSTFFHSAHISQRPHILRILLKMLTCYFKNVGCAYFFADHINGLWRNVSEVQCTFFQFDRNYAWR